MSTCDIVTRPTGGSSQFDSSDSVLLTSFTADSVLFLGDVVRLAVVDGFGDKDDFDDALGIRLLDLRFSANPY